MDADVWINELQEKCVDSHCVE